MVTSVAAALEQLRGRRLPLTFAAARTYLETCLDRANLLALYQHYFPQQYTASTASIQPAEGAVYSAREGEFFQLVDAHLFPLPLESFLEEYDGVRAATIPVMAIGVDWWMDSIEDLRPGWQLLLLLAGEVTAADTEVDPRFLTLYQKRAKPRPRGRRVGWDAFKTACAAAGAHLAALPLALDVLAHDTGNIWLDPSAETPVLDAEWCIGDMDLLAQEYQEALRIIDQVYPLLDWIEAAPAHFGKVITLWNHAKLAPASPPM